MNRYICIHGHFYQPPRENPWLEEVEGQDSAKPYHDWNERITAECYGPNTASRILDADGLIVDIVNNYSRMSFNFGPTLLSWMAGNAPRVYEGIREADQASLKRFDGHGSAMAQVFNHMIMPLANLDDKRTQVHWGLTDFRQRFGRDPEGMWLPECAVNTESLEVLAEFGMKFVVLAPHQYRRFKGPGQDPQEWIDSPGGIDPTAAYACALPSGKRLVVFFYDGPISADVGFTDLLQNGQTLHDRLINAFADNGREWPQLVHIATDGETYGHHHGFGDMALAYCLDLFEKDPSVELINYGQYLAKHPPTFEVEIMEDSSWSCVHGIERWRADCGCNSGGHQGWNQGWRAPLRQAMELVGQKCLEVLTGRGKEFFKDPMAARKAYIQVMLNRSPENVDAFLAEQGQKAPDAENAVTMLKIMEMARMAQLCFTSCGWFFDEISGLEGVQVMQYAARAMQLCEELSGPVVQPEYVEILNKAPSNVLGSGAEAFKRYALGAKADLNQVAAQTAITALFEGYGDAPRIGCYQRLSEPALRLRSTSMTIAVGQGRVDSCLTREFLEFVYASVSFGGHNVISGVDRFLGQEDFKGLQNGLGQAFEHGDHDGVVSAIHGRFFGRTYSLAKLFHDDQSEILGRVLSPVRRQALAAYRQVFEDNLDTLKYLRWLGAPLPSLVLDAGRHVVQLDLMAQFSKAGPDLKVVADLVNTAREWNLDLDTQRLAVVAGDWLGGLAERFQVQPADMAVLTSLVQGLETLAPLNLPMRIWKAQNACFQVGRQYKPKIETKAKSGREGMGNWMEVYTKLAGLLRVRLPQPWTAPA